MTFGHFIVEWGYTDRDKWSCHKICLIPLTFPIFEAPQAPRQELNPARQILPWQTIQLNTHSTWIPSRLVLLMHLNPGICVIYLEEIKVYINMVWIICILILTKIGLINNFLVLVIFNVIVSFSNVLKRNL